MKIILSDNSEIEILAINFDSSSFDWRRTFGYQGACNSKLVSINFETFEEDAKMILEQELINAES